MTTLLALDTTRTSRNIRIDGTTYPLVDPLDMDLVTLGRLEGIGARFESLGGLMQAGGDDASLAELSAILQSAVGELLKAPADVLARLSDPQRLGIVVAYMGEHMADKTGRPARKATRKPATKRGSAKRR